MGVRISDKTKELRKIKTQGFYYKTYPTGLSGLDEIFKVVKGFPLYIGGQVHNGKSEFTLELAVSMSMQYGFVYCCYLGEAGTVEMAFIEIAQKVVGKSYFDFKESDHTYAEQFIQKHFVLLEIEDLTVKGFYKEVLKTEKELEIKFDGTIFDPFNDAKNESGAHGGTHIWLEEDLKYIRNESQKHNRNDIVVFHVRDLEATLDKESGHWYIRAALPTEWSGGQVVHRRAFQQLLVHRIPKWSKDENGVPYGDNKTLIKLQKAKPKGSSKIGQRVLNWDWKKNRYFEELEVGSKKAKKYMLDKLPIFQQEENVLFSDVIENDPF